MTHRRNSFFGLGFGIERLGLLPLKRPLVSGLIMLLISIAALFGSFRLSVDDSLSELFRTDTEEFHRYERISELFPSSEFDVLIVTEGRTLLDRASVLALQSAVLDLNLVEGVKGVVSFFSAREQLNDEGYAPPLFTDEIPEGAAYDRLIERLHKNQIVAGKMLSDDGRLSLIVMALDRKAVGQAGLATVIAEIRGVLAENLDKTGLTTRLTGAPVMQLEIRNAVNRDRLLYNGLGFLLGALIALIFFRSFSLMLIAAAGPAAAIVWSLGTLALLDFRLNLFVNVIIPLITVNGFSDSMHLVFNIRRDVMMGVAPKEAARNAVHRVAPACFLTALTAAIALASFIFAESALIRTFGAASTIAVLLSYFAVVWVVPTMAALLLRERPATAGGDVPHDGGMALLSDASVRLFEHVERWATGYLLAGILMVVVTGWTYGSLEPHYRLADQVPDREQALEATGRLDEKLTGANPVHMVVELPKDAPLYSDRSLDLIAAVHRIVEEQAGVGNVWSIETLRRWLKQSGKPDIATLKEFVGILPEHLTQRFVAPSQEAVVITGRLPDIDAAELLPVVDGLDAALEPLRQANPGYELYVTGLPAIAARNSAQMIWELNVGLISDIFIVIVFIGLAFRSWFAGIVSILPSLFPIFATGAMLYVTGAGFHFASIIALTVAFGLALDSTIHFINRFHLEELGPDGHLRTTRDTLAHTARMIGPVLVLTTIVLALGLGVTILSDMPSLREFGQLSGATLMAALFAQLIILPASIVVVRRFFRAARDGASVQKPSDN